MKVDYNALRRILGQAGVATFVGGLFDGILSGGVFSALLLSLGGVLLVLFAVVRR